MSQTRKLSYSFAGGEVTPEFWGQVNDSKFQAGLALCRNMLIKPHGPATNRAGTMYVRAAKTLGKRVRLISFTFSSTQTMVLEFGDTYIRFHTLGATLLNAGVPYEVATPYLEADLPLVRVVQSNDVLTIVHPLYPPKELRRLSSTNWTLTDISFGSTINIPNVTSVTPTGTGTVTYTYGVTGVAGTGLEESAISAPASITNNLATGGNSNLISWTSVGSPRFNVYRQSNGLFGFIGQTDGTNFVDNNIIPNLGKTPPILSTPFNGVGFYPGAASYFEQRRCFAGSINEPQTLRMTRSGTESNLSYSIPQKDEDAISIKVAAREANTIRHMVPLSSLLILTAAAEWRVTSVNTDAVTPTSISVKPQSYVGANNAQPVVVNNNVLYVAARGGHMREMAYSFQAGGYITGDLSLRAPHLFDGFDISDLAYAKAPQPLVWSVSTSGKLIGLTYVPEQQLGAIHQHDTQGLFESCCVVAEGTEDVLYVVVNRLLNGVQTRCIERMQTRAFATQADEYFMDCGATYSGAPASTITGLTWLVGQTVSVLGDGAVFPQKVVDNTGAITLEQPCSKVQVGLPYVSDLNTLPLFSQIDNGYAQGRLKNVNRVFLRVKDSSGVFAGPRADKLRQFKQRTIESPGTPPMLTTDEIEIVLDPSWQSGGQVFIRQSDPLPLTVISMVVEVEIGGG